MLLALAGGTPTIDLADQRALVDEIRPRVVIPMHFKTPKVDLSILPLDAFLRAFDAYPREAFGSELAIARDDLPGETTVYTMAHAR